MCKYLLLMIICMGTNLCASAKKTVLNYGEFDVQVSLHDSVNKTNQAFNVPKAHSKTNPGKVVQSMGNVSHVNVIKDGKVVNCLPGQPCSKTIVDGTKISSRDLPDNTNKPLTITIVQTSDDTVSVSYEY